jgi:CheY-like chemotaxis protein
VRLAIADTGTGIPPEIQPHIFDPFFTTKAPGKGTGLGLAQVHGIVTQHNGFITAKTTVGQGTTFAIYLPATPAAEVTTPSQAPDTGINGNGERILLVEDNAALRMALVDMLESLNYAVVDAPDGRAALAHLAAPDAAFALVLSDVVMPDIGGVALVKALRERDISVPVVLMSGHPLDDELPPLQDAGMVVWLPKPCPMDRLAQTIATSLSR